MPKQVAEGELKVEGKSMAKQVAEGGLKVEEKSGKKRKKNKVKFNKEYIVFLLKMGHPRPFPAVSRPCAVQLELAAYAQKRIDRYEQIREQYEQKGYAEIEYTDDEDAVEIDDAQLIPPRARKVSVKEFAEMMELPLPSWRSEDEWC